GTPSRPFWRDPRGSRERFPRGRCKPAFVGNKSVSCRCKCRCTRNRFRISPVSRAFSSLSNSPRIRSKTFPLMSVLRKSGTSRGHPAHWLPMLACDAEKRVGLPLDMPYHLGVQAFQPARGDGGDAV